MNYLQTIIEGALGALTFGIYYHYTTMRGIKNFNEKWEKIYETQLEAKIRQRKKFSY